MYFCGPVLAVKDPGNSDLLAGFGISLRAAAYRLALDLLQYSRGVPTLRIPVSGERQNLFGSLKTLLGIGSVRNYSGK